MEKVFAAAREEVIADLDKFLADQKRHAAANPQDYEDTTPQDIVLAFYEDNG